MATKKQLAALAKARAARKKNLGSKKPLKRASKKTVSKNPVKRAGASNYVLKVSTTSGKVGYYSGFDANHKPTFDDDPKNAFSGSHRVMNNIMALVFTIKPRGIKSLEIVKK